MFMINRNSCRIVKTIVIWNEREAHYVIPLFEAFYHINSYIIDWEF